MAWPSFFPKPIVDLLETRVFASQATPNPDKNFFQNYYSHVKQLGINLEETTKGFFKSEDMLEFLINEILGHMNMLDALRDGYDYADEVAGATVVEWLGSALTFGLVAAAVWQGAHMLAINTGLVEDDGEYHGTSAVLLLLAAAAVFAITAAIFAKSVISLVSRPIITLINDFKPQDVNRFYEQDIADRNENLLTGFGAVAEALFRPTII